MSSRVHITEEETLGAKEGQMLIFGSKPLPPMVKVTLDFHPADRQQAVDLLLEVADRIAKDQRGLDRRQS